MACPVVSRLDLDKTSIAQWLFQSFFDGILENSVVFATKNRFNFWNFIVNRRVEEMNKNFAEHRDDDLIDQTLEGQQEAFGALVRKYQDRLYNGMVQILRNEAEAEDAVQEAFILALTKLQSFQRKSGFFTWLYRIAYNVAISRLRKRKPTVSIENQVPEVRLQVPGNQPRPDAGLIESERANQLMQALDRMSEEHRIILVLREMEDMDYLEISEVLDLPIGTVRSRLHRARIQLKEMLEAMLD